MTLPPAGLIPVSPVPQHDIPDSGIAAAPIVVFTINSLLFIIFISQNNLSLLVLTIFRSADQVLLFRQAGIRIFMEVHSYEIALPDKA